MIRMRCRVAAINDGLDLGAIAPERLATFIAAHFKAGSGGDIHLDVEVRRDFPTPLAAGAPASDFHLHDALSRLTSNPPDPPIDTIGLLIAEAYLPCRPVFGLMFDRGVPTREGDLFSDVPREGAAVFTSAIGARRPPGQALDELFFTAVHELGHVFNLWHAPRSPPSFMTSSGLDGAYGPGAYVFQPEHRDWLARCSQDSLVRPGGSRFLDRGIGLNVPAAARGSAGDRLELRVGVSPARCWRFEPVQLDVEITLTGRDGERASLPAIVDPSHAGFRVFIEGPGGRVRRYRSSILSCAPAGRITVTRSRPYRRDIPIFLQADGYTFPCAGRYYVFAECDVRPGQTLRSEAVELEVLSQRARERDAVDNLRRLRQPALSTLLYYRNTHDEASLERVSALIGEWGWRYSARQSLLAYLWARTVTRCARELRTRPREQLARDRLKACLDRENLGAHRRDRAVQMMSDG
jgi:hypothetical protein